MHFTTSLHSTFNANLITCETIKNFFKIIVLIRSQLSVVMPKGVAISQEWLARQTASAQPL